MQNVFLAAVFTDQKLPAALGLEHGFDRFAERTVPAGELSNKLRCSTHLAAGIGRGDGQPDDFQDGQVWQIVADVGDLFRPETQLVHQLHDHGQLVLDPLPHEIDSKFGGTNTDDLRRAASDKTKTMTRLLPEFDPQTIADVKAFAFDALVVKDHAAIGQDTIDVRKQ